MESEYETVIIEIAEEIQEMTLRYGRMNWKTVE